MGEGFEGEPQTFRRILSLSRFSWWRHDDPVEISIDLRSSKRRGTVGRKGKKSTHSLHSGSKWDEIDSVLECVEIDAFHSGWKWDEIEAFIAWTKTSLPWAPEWVSERASERMSAAERASEASSAAQASESAVRANKWISRWPSTPRVNFAAILPIVRGIYPHFCSASNKPTITNVRTSRANAPCTPCYVFQYMQLSHLSIQSNALKCVLMPSNTFQV